MTFLAMYNDFNLSKMPLVVSTFATSVNSSFKRLKYIALGALESICSPIMPVNLFKIPFNAF